MEPNHSLLFLRRPSMSIMWSFLGLAMLGCGSGSVSVTGTVTLDGSPLAEAFVSFTPDDGGRPVSITTNDSGEFAFDDGTPPGLLAGVYKVTVSKTERLGLPPGIEEGGPIPADFDPASAKEHWVTPRKYAKTSTSGLTANVERGMSPVALNLISDE